MGKAGLDIYVLWCTLLKEENTVYVETFMPSHRFILVLYGFKKSKEVKQLSSILRRIFRIQPQRTLEPNPWASSSRPARRLAEGSWSNRKREANQGTVKQPRRRVRQLSWLSHDDDRNCAEGRNRIFPSASENRSQKAPLSTRKKERFARAGRAGEVLL